MLKRLHESLYLKIYINIVIKHSTTVVYIESCNHSGIVSSVSQEFKTVLLSDEMYEFVDGYIKDSPYHYITILDPSATQGAIASCKTENISKTIDVNDMITKCYYDKWTYFTTRDTISNLQKTYAQIGLDFVFSPFIVISDFFKDKINSHLALFVLIEDASLSICVFDNSALLFAMHLDMTHEALSEDMSIDDIDEDVHLDIDADDEGINLDDIDALDELDVLDGLDDFGDIEDLDSIDEIDEFSDARDIEEEFSEQATASAQDSEVMVTGESGSFSEDYHRYSMIQSSLNTFYKDKSFDSKFIETIYIADGVGVSSDLKRYLEEEMFLSVYVRQIDISMEICELAKSDLK